MIESLFGGDLNAPYYLTRWLLQRGIAAIYLIAFAVIINQFRPLLGSHGLLPVPYWLRGVPFARAPSLFYLGYSDKLAMTLAWIGLGCSTLALLGMSERFGTPASMIIWFVMWLFYLSFVNVGQTFYSFGWETLLLECGVLAIFLGARNTAPPVVVIWMFRWLLLRIMLGAGLIKLRGDPCWRDLTCLVYHYQSQPIPNPLSWYFHRLPIWMNKGGVLFNHLAEVIAPFGYLLPVRWVVRTAGLITIVFQLSIVLSGNLSWLNWLTIVVAFSCLDDGMLRFLPVHAGALSPIATPHQLALGVWTVVVISLSIKPLLNLFSSAQAMNTSFEPLHLVNSYGAFGSISRTRSEVIFEGTADSVVTPTSVWREYEFRSKPGSVSRRPTWLAPYHRRIDWLMWFAALSPQYADPWFVPFAVRLLQNDQPTLKLIAGNPFPNKPPTWIRARMFDYRFVSVNERKTTGDWWVRTLQGEYLRPISLNTEGLIQNLESRGFVR